MTKKKGLRILASGDIHGDSLLVQKLAKRAVDEDVDLVVLCGDLSGFGQNTDNLIGPFVKQHKKVLLIPGNHDNFATADFLAEVYGVKNIHGYSVRYKDIGLFGCGGANIGPERLNEKEIYDLLKKGFDNIKYLKKKIMVTHMHPTNTKMEKLSQFVPGSPGVMRAIEKFKPDILLCSHVHEAAGIEEKIGSSKVVNVAKNGKVIEIK